MKFVLIFSLLFSLQSFANEVTETNDEGKAAFVDAGVGFGMHGTTGLIGVSANYHFNAHDVLGMSMAADLNGGFVGLSYKYFDKKIERHMTGTFFDKCLFLFDCDTYPYVEVGTQYFSKTTRTVTSDGAADRIFEMDGKLLALIGFGTHHVFKNNMFWDFSLSYRTLLTGGETRLVSGVEQAYDRTWMHWGNNAMGFGMTIGYQF